MMRVAAYHLLRARTVRNSIIVRETLSKRSRCSLVRVESFPIPSKLFASVSSSSIICHNIITTEIQNRCSLTMMPKIMFLPVLFTNPVPITARTIATKISVHTSDSSYLNNLRRKTKAWLQIPVNTWTRVEVSKGRFLIREWSKFNSNSNNSINRERALEQTKILRRWVRERKAAIGNDRLRSVFESQMGKKNADRDKNNHDSQEMVEMLNRCLDSWRKAVTVPLLSTSSTMGATASKKRTPQLESMSLIHLFREASKSLDDKDFLPNQKTYSMCMNVLSLHPESSTVCDDVLSLMQQCKETTKPDLQFYNVCLHTLAKCATYHVGAPFLVERIFREMETASKLSLNTACFVSVLHAWANSIPTNAAKAKGYHDRGDSEVDTDTKKLAAKRAEAILKQMVRDYPQLVDTICFNICIDAWGKQGHPEKAEAVLWWLHQFRGGTESGDDPSLETKMSVRPNQISFNSAINAWSKFASGGGNGGQDPQMAADRAGRLFQQMKLQGLEPTPETFGSLMEANINTPDPGLKVQSFLDELEKMYSNGVISLPPTKVCYLMVIRAWGRTKPGGAERAESLVRRLEEVFTREDGDRAELAPCTILYTSLISAWAQSDVESAPDRARNIFWEMRQMVESGRNNASPNTISLNAVLTAFCNHDRIDEAREFLAKTKRAVRPDSKSYMTILKAYANSNAPNAAEKAQEFLGELEDNYRYGDSTTKPSIRMYSQILVAWGNSRKNDAAFRAEEIFWQLMREEDEGICVSPDTSTFNCVLRAWSKSSEGGAAERAEAFLQKVQEEHPEEISIDAISHLHLIYAWAHSRRKKAPKQAEKHLEQARALCRSSGQRSNWRLTRSHFNGTILAWKKSYDSNTECYIRKLKDERDSIFQP